MILLTGKKKNKGFLLLEATLSIAILSIGLILILGSFIRSIRAIEFSEDYFKAGLLLEEKIFEVHNTDLKEGLSDGVFTNFGNIFLWRLNIIKLEGEPLNEVDLRVLWNRRNKEQDISILTYLHTT